MEQIQPVMVGPGEGRLYEMGAISALFKADDKETGGRYSVSEWILEPMHEGPGAHRHDDNDEMFYVLEGTATILIGKHWHRMPTGSFCLIPRGVMHDFRNEGEVRIRLLNVFVPGPFERLMPEIADWFRLNPVTRIS